MPIRGAEPGEERRKGGRREWSERYLRVLVWCVCVCGGEGREVSHVVHEMCECRVGRESVCWMDHVVVGGVGCKRVVVEGEAVGRGKGGASSGAKGRVQK